MQQVQREEGWQEQGQENGMILVAGPPCGGKTTYVKQHARPTDRVVDWDDIIEELGGTRYQPTPEIEAQAHHLWRQRLPSADYMIWRCPNRVTRGRFRARYNARVVVVMASMRVCLDRAKAQRPPIWQANVRQWFAEWQPSSSGREVIIDTGVIQKRISDDGRRSKTNFG